MNAFPGAIVPPLPPTDKVYKDDRFSIQFIQRRQAGLELFLRRVATHAALAKSDDLLTFLEAKVWELQTAKNASTASWTSSLLDSTDASFKRVSAALRSKTPDDDEIERLRSFSAEYYKVVVAAEAAHLTTVGTLQLQADDLSHLGPAFDLLSQSERELSLPFTRMAKELDALRELYLRHVQAEHVSGLTSLLAFNQVSASPASPHISPHLPTSPHMPNLHGLRSPSVCARTSPGDGGVAQAGAQEPRPRAHSV